MQCFIVDYSYPSEGTKGYLIVEAASIQEAYDITLDWLKVKQPVMHLELKIIGNNNNPFTIIKKETKSTSEDVDTYGAVYIQRASSDFNLTKDVDVEVNLEDGKIKFVPSEEESQSSMNSPTIYCSKRDRTMLRILANCVVEVTFQNGHRQLGLASYFTDLDSEFTFRFLHE